MRGNIAAGRILEARGRVASSGPAPHKGPAALRGPGRPRGALRGRATSLHCDFPSKIVQCCTKSPKHNSVTQQFGPAGHQAGSVEVLRLVREGGEIAALPALGPDSAVSLGQSSLWPGGHRHISRARCPENRRSRKTHIEMTQLSNRPRDFGKPAGIWDWYQKSLGRQMTQLSRLCCQ